MLLKMADLNYHEVCVVKQTTISKEFSYSVLINYEVSCSESCLWGIEAGLICVCIYIFIFIFIYL